MWIPFTQTEEEALFSTAAAVSYGCIASIHPAGVWSRRSPAIQPTAIALCKPCYALGHWVSGHLADTRPSRFAVIHVSQRSRNARIADPRAIWVEFFAPVLGAFETLKEAHWPVATLNDLQLEQEIGPEARVVVLPHSEELADSQQSVLRAFEAAGGTLVRLDADRGWHRKADKPQRKQELLAKISARIPSPPIRVRGPAAMHAVFFSAPHAPKTVVCLVNDFGWFRSEREPAGTATRQKPPAPCTGVEVEVADARPVRQALEAVTGRPLAVRRENGKTRISVPDFAIMACVVVE
jgi:hypothetical protein